MTAFAQIERCRRHQLPPDVAQLDHHHARSWLTEAIKPNLLLVTGPPHACSPDCILDDSEHPLMLPVMELRAG